MCSNVVIAVHGGNGMNYFKLHFFGSWSQRIGYQDGIIIIY